MRTQVYYGTSVFGLNGAAPPVSFGRDGNVTNGSWLIHSEVFSNRTGCPVNLVNAEIQQIWVRSQDLNTYDVTIYEHDGDEINLTSLVTVSCTASRGENFGVADFGTITPAQDKQLAVKVTSGNAKNLKVFLIVAGNYE